MKETMMPAESSMRLRHSAEFQSLVSRRSAISLSLTAIMLIVYFGFVLILAFDKSVLAAKIGEHMTVGIPVGVGIILFAWILTGVYVWWANNAYDTAVQQMKKDMRS
jgi:uncharacterized membrane protein (DUF485 family)